MRHVSQAWLHHNHIPKTGELGNGKDLGEYIRQVSLRLYMYRYQYALVAKNFDPFLASVNVFELGLLCVVVSKGFSPQAGTNVTETVLAQWCEPASSLWPCCWF